MSPETTSGSHQYPAANWETYNAGYGANTILTGISDNGGSKPCPATGGLMYLTGVGYANTSLYKSFEATMENKCPIQAPGSATPEPPKNSNVYLEAAGSNPQGSYINAVGYFVPSTTTALCARSQKVTCGFIYDPHDTTSGGEYPQDPNEGTSATCGGTVLTSTEGANIQVGYYLKPNGTGTCQAHAIEEYSYPAGSTPGGPQWIEFDLSSLLTTANSALGSITNSWAYGINDEGDVVGAFTASGSGFGEHYYIGWRLKAFKYTILQYNDAPGTGVVSSMYPSTVPKDIGFDSTAVGYYVDKTTKAKIHGFEQFQGWAPLNYGDVASTDESVETIVNGYNDAAYIVGQYRNSGGAWKGFIAQCKSDC